MKKIISFTIAFLLVTLINLPVFSADTTFEGEFRIRSYSEWNFDKKFNDIDDAQFDGWFEQRFRLKITHTRSEYLKAVVMLDLVEDTWGQGRAMYINHNPDSWGVTANYIDWAYLEFTSPKIGTFRVGQFPVSWGHKLTHSFFFLDGIEWSKQWGIVNVTLLYAKISDNVTSGPMSPGYNRDGDLYSLHIGVMPSENHLIELFGGFYKDTDFTNWPGGIIWIADAGDLNQYFVGLAYTGTIADMIDVKFEASYIWGKYNTRNGLMWPKDHRDVEGYSIYADVSYFNDLFRVGFAFLWRSGEAADINMTSVGNMASYDFKWANIIGNDDYGLNSVYVWNPYYFSALSNIISTKLYFEICPMDKLTINAAVIWARGEHRVGPNSYRGHPANYYGKWNYDVVNDADYGWEVDFGFSYEIMEGLTYSFAGGVLFTGDAWDYDADTGAGVDRQNWGEIWSIVNTLTYEF